MIRFYRSNFLFKNHKFLSFICIASFLTSVLSAQDSDYIQDVKAVFIYNFTKYIHWAESSESSTFNIAIIGEDQIIDPLRQIAEKRQVNQKNIRILSIENPEDIENCQIIFIPESQQTHLNEIITRTENKNTLIVSEIRDSLSSGVMINFLISQETIKFEINLQAMKKARLEPGSELLKLAVRIIE